MATDFEFVRDRERQSSGPTQLGLAIAHDRDEPAVVTRHRDPSRDATTASQDPLPGWETTLGGTIEAYITHTQTASGTIPKTTARTPRKKAKEGQERCQQCSRGPLVDGETSLRPFPFGGTKAGPGDLSASTSAKHHEDNPFEGTTAGPSDLSAPASAENHEDNPFRGTTAGPGDLITNTRPTAGPGDLSATRKHHRTTAGPGDLSASTKNHETQTTAGPGDLSAAQKHHGTTAGPGDLPASTKNYETRTTAGPGDLSAAQKHHGTTAGPGDLSASTKNHETRTTAGPGDLSPAQKHHGTTAGPGDLSASTKNHEKRTTAGPGDLSAAQKHHGTTAGPGDLSASTKNHETRTTAGPGDLTAAQKHHGTTAGPGDLSAPRKQHGDIPFGRTTAGKRCPGLASQKLVHQDPKAGTPRNVFKDPSGGNPMQGNKSPKAGTPRKTHQDPKAGTPHNVYKDPSGGNPVRVQEDLKAVTSRSKDGAPTTPGQEDKEDHEAQTTEEIHSTRSSSWGPLGDGEPSQRPYPFGETTTEVCAIAIPPEPDPHVNEAHDDDPSEAKPGQEEEPELEPWVRDFLERELAQFETLTGVTHIAEHVITMKDDRPIKQRQPSVPGPRARAPTSGSTLRRSHPRQRTGTRSSRRQSQTTPGDLKDSEGKRATSHDRSSSPLQPETPRVAPRVAQLRPG
ncbi:hypothetical protein ACLKA7_012136 [Drosophila subpalustris]